MYLIFLLYALFGSVFTAGKISLDHAQPFFIVGSRMLLSGVIIVSYLFVFKRNTLSNVKKNLGKIFLLGFFNIYLTNGFEFWGMKFLSSSKTSFIYSLSPFFTAILSFFILKEKLSRKKLLGLAIGFIGFIPILWQGSQLEEGLLSFGFISIAEAAVIIASLATVYGWILMRQLIIEDVNPITANGFSMLIGGLFSLMHSLAIESWNPVPVTGSVNTFLESVAWMIIISNFICYNLYGYLLKHYTTTFMSFSGFTTPFFVALFSWFAVGEILDAYFYVSAILVFMGLCLFYVEELKKEGLRKQEQV